MRNRANLVSDTRSLSSRFAILHPTNVGLTRAQACSSKRLTYFLPPLVRATFHLASVAVAGISAGRPCPWAHGSPL
jgi:hypothetical protein